jgi:hypothetical protein
MSTTQITAARGAVNPSEHVPPLGTAGDLIDTILDRIALHLRARFSGCSHLMLNEITDRLLDLCAEIERLLREHEENVARLVLEHERCERENAET